MRTFGGLAAVAVAATAWGCTIKLVNEEPRRRYSCQEVQEMPQEQVRALVAERGSELQRKGRPIDRSLATDRAAYDAYVRAIELEVGCDLSQPEGTASSGLHHGGDNEYCGPGHGSHVFPVSDCLNGACREHDACYAGCSERTGDTSGCYFSGVTDACDQTFFKAADACPHEHLTMLKSETVLFVAHGLSAIGGEASGCTAGTQCPAVLMTGFGPCAVNRKSQQCSACLAQVDPAGACHKAACEGDLLDNVCYAASCAETAKCFGWDKTPTPPPPPPDKCDPECGKGFRCELNKCAIDEEAAWEITVVRGGVSALDPADGLDWDGWPYEEPEPKVCLTYPAGGGGCVGEVQDTHNPVWEQPLPGAPSRASLRKPLQYSYTDVDLSVFDPICSGEFSITDEDLVSGAKTVVCEESPTSWFEIRLTAK